MREYKGTHFSDNDIGDLTDRSLKQFNMSASDIQLDEGRHIDLARTAAFLLKSRAIRAERFGNGKADIDDVSWHILLHLIISTDTKKAVTALDLARTLNLATSTTRRYVEYLIAAGLVDKQIDAKNLETVALKLTQSGDALTSDTLRKIGQGLINI